MFSFLFSLSIVIILSVISHFYMKESINTLQAEEEHHIGCYANRVTNQEQTLEEFKKRIFGSIEFFTYKVAIFDKKHNIIYSTFDKQPSFNTSAITYIKDDAVYYNHTKLLTDIGMVKMVFKKHIDYQKIYTKGYIIITASLVFLLGCSLFLYFHIKGIYENINKKLDAFFKDAIHEIRTPLGVVQINLDFLDNTIEDSMPLKRAQGGLRNLTSVYESLEYSIKNKTVKYKKEHINLSQFLANRIDFFNVLAEVKEIEIQSKIESGIFAYISRIEIQRLIDNNLSNAIKYAKEKTKMYIFLYSKNKEVCIEFSNSGDGIKEKEKIFERYYRGDEIKGGFGIGLSIVEYICNIYNIKYSVDSKDGYTTFLYIFPPNVVKKDIT